MVCTTLRQRADVLPTRITHPPFRHSAHLHTYGQSSPQERDLAKANAKIAKLQKAVEELKASGKKSGVDTTLEKLTKNALEIHRAEAARVKCLEEMADLKTTMWRVGDQVTYTLPGGAEAQGVVTERPLCVSNNAKPGDEPTCFYSKTPPKCEKHLKQEGESARTGGSSVTMMPLRLRSGGMVSDATAFKAGDLVSAQIGEQGTWTDATVQKANGVALKLDGAPGEQCVFPK